MPTEPQAREVRERLVTEFSEGKIAATVHRPHCIVRETWEHSADVAREARKRRAWGDPDYWSQPRQDKGRYFATAKDGIPMLVSLAQVSRSLRILILDALLAELMARGWSVVSDEEAGGLA
jgi:hypothetical protein